MAAGKLLRTITIASILMPSIAMAQASYQPSISGDHMFSRTLDSADMAIYKQALMVMLQNMPLGQTMDWYSQTNPGTKGHIRVVYGYQTTNGYCRVYQSEISKPTDIKSFQQYACISEDNPRWEFYNK
jgi:surface antigen